MEKMVFGPPFCLIPGVVWGMGDPVTQRTGREPPHSLSELSLQDNPVDILKCWRGSLQKTSPCLRPNLFAFAVPLCRGLASCSQLLYLVPQ